MYLGNIGLKIQDLTKIKINMVKKMGTPRICHILTAADQGVCRDLNVPGDV